MGNKILFGKRSVGMQDGGRREGPIEARPKFDNLNPLQNKINQILRIPAWA